MSDALLTQLFDFGALGIFASFLIWQYVGMQKRLDAMVTRFQEQLDKINADYDERIEGMRIRYDTVIERIRAESDDRLKDCHETRDDLIKSLGVNIGDAVAKLDDSLRKQDTALGKLDEGLVEMRTHYREQALERRVRSDKKKDC
jgi:DNA anti-recombination protein RmuC